MPAGHSVKPTPPAGLARRDGASPPRHASAHTAYAWRSAKIYSLIDTVDRTHIISDIAAFIHTHNCPNTALDWIPNLLLDCIHDIMTLDKKAIAFICDFFDIKNDTSTISSLVASARPQNSMDPLETIIGYHPQASALLVAILHNTVCNNHNPHTPITAL